jgi:CRISPR-associated endonuclease Cas3-HD
MALERHLLGVASRAREATPADATTADGKSLRDATEIVGLAHDFGKATEWFQTHIGNGTDDDGPSHHARLGGLLAYYALRQRGYGPRTRFAGLVAVAKHHGSLPDSDQFAQDGIKQRATWARDNAYNGAAAGQAAHIERLRPEFSCAVLDRLVGEEGSWTDFLTRLTASSDAVDTVGGPPDATLHEWLTRDLFRGRRGVRLDRTLFEDGSVYLDELRLYGALTFADKTHAAGVRSDDDRLHAESLTTAQMRDHIDGLGNDGDPETLETRLNGLRGAIQDHIQGKSASDDPITSFLDSPSRVATLTLPTGYGKTLTGLLAAARIREATDGDRIIYALPFTSVIDQTADVLREVLSDESDEDPAMGRRLTVHHHLSESLTISDEEDESDETDEDAGEAVMLAESWRAGVTLTTFVQLFESLAGPRNTQSMKLPALYESVIVIDEPQALPLTWWPLVERLVEALVVDYDATVVLMTATQPRIIGDDETFSLLNSETLEALEPSGDAALPDRVEYEFHPTALATDSGDEPLGYDDAAAILAAAAAGTTDATLAICNTVDSTGELFDCVAEELGMATDSETTATHGGPVDVAARFETEVLDDDRFGVPSTTNSTRLRAEFVRSIVSRAGPTAPAVLYLSTRLRPCDRRFLLTVASELTAAEIPLLVVSTQLVEAGVDVSFDRVFRDFAPLDSIVQAAGRCNRSFERAPDTGSVTVWRLGPPGDSSTVPGEAVYARREGDTDLDLLAKTREALTDVPTGETVPESQIAETAVDTYHEVVGDAVETVAGDNALRRHFDRADGATLRGKSLIENQFTFEVYVCRSRVDYMIVEVYRRAEDSYNFDGANRLKTYLADICVSVPVYRRDSEAARTMLDLDPLSMSADKRDATERVFRNDEPRHERFFDAQRGVSVPESNVEALFL